MEASLHDWAFQDTGAVGSHARGSLCLGVHCPESSGALSLLWSSGQCDKEYTPAAGVTAVLISSEAASMLGVQA